MINKKLTYSQKRIVVCNEPRIIVKACPGSGKTFSVTARLARLLSKNKLGRYQGIAILSFTNAACDEIRKGLKEDWGINDIGYPYFIGTLDKFINDYIFLPFGHLVMGCKMRPEIVGTEYNRWFDYDPSIREPYKHKKICDPNYYFDKVSLSENDSYHLTQLMPDTMYHFSWKKEKWYKKDKNKNLKYEKILDGIYEAKWNNFKKGKANQADANYFANSLLAEYPKILSNLINRFPILIIDEAQDTTEVQMSIIDKLDNASISSIMLIGDPFQAIFEWNTANPELFLEKWENKNWHQIELQENMRSSTHICNYLNNFFNSEMKSIAKDRDCNEVPEILGYSEGNNDSVNAICKQFNDKCSKLRITQDNLAIVYRGQSFGEEYFNQINQIKLDSDLPWERDSYFVRDIVHGKFLIESGIFRDGFRLIEKGYHKFILGERYISQSVILEKKNKKGYRKYRKDIFDFIYTIPSIDDKKLNDWIDEVNNNNNSYNFTVKKNKANIQISNIFNVNNKKSENDFFRTIHSVKGETLDAILVFLKKRDNSNYNNIIKKDYDSLSKKKDKEQMRIVYVACSRPRRILWIAVPEEDFLIWNDFSNNKKEDTQKQLELSFPE